jgi:putative transposase
VLSAEEALTAFEASFWGQRYLAIRQSWRRAWPEVIPFFAFPDEVRRIVYTTNAIEALNSKLVGREQCDVRFGDG